MRNCAYSTVDASHNRQSTKVGVKQSLSFKHNLHKRDDGSRLSMSITSFSLQMKAITIALTTPGKGSNPIIVPVSIQTPSSNLSKRELIPKTVLIYQIKNLNKWKCFQLIWKTNPFCTSRLSSDLNFVLAKPLF